MPIPVRKLGCYWSEAFDAFVSSHRQNSASMFIRPKLFYYASLDLPHLTVSAVSGQPLVSMQSERWEHY
jgi:hypothetical protein